MDTGVEGDDVSECFRRQRVKDLSKEKKDKLSDSLLYAQFNRDVAEVKLTICKSVKLVPELKIN